jgi:hypothetical protein
MNQLETISSIWYIYVRLMRTTEYVYKQLDWKALIENSLRRTLPIECSYRFRVFIFSECLSDDLPLGDAFPQHYNILS